MLSADFRSTVIDIDCALIEDTNSGYIDKLKKTPDDFHEEIREYLGPFVGERNAHFDFYCFIGNKKGTKGARIFLLKEKQQLTLKYTRMGTAPTSQMSEENLKDLIDACHLCQRLNIKNFQQFRKVLNKYAGYIPDFFEDCEEEFSANTMKKKWSLIVSYAKENGIMPFTPSRTLCKINMMAPVV